MESAIEIKKITLEESILEMLEARKIESKDAIVEISKVIMCDLNISFKDALIFFESCLKKQEIITNNLEAELKKIE